MLADSTGRVILLRGRGDGDEEQVQGKRIPLLLGKIGLLAKAFITGLARQSARSFQIGATDMNKDERKPGKVKVVYGCCVELDMAEWTLDRIRVALREFIDIGSDIDVFLDGKRVSAGYRKVEAGQVLAFFHNGLKEWRGNCLQCSRNCNGNVSVVYGAYYVDRPLAGYTIAEIQVALRDEINVDMDTPAYVDGHRVADKDQKMEAGQSLEFCADPKPIRRRVNRRGNEAGGAAAEPVVAKRRGAAVDGMLHLREAAAHIGMTVSGLRKLVDKKEIRYFQRKAHSPILFKSEWLDDYICGHTHDPKDEQTPAAPPTRKKRAIRTEDRPDNRHGFRPDLMRG